MKLTEDQARIVAENHNLIYWFANKNHLNINEYYDLLAIELCYTVIKYDETKGSLANLFNVRANGMVSKELRKARAKKRIPVEYASSYVGNYVDKSDSLEELMEIEDWLESSDFEEVLRMKNDGYSQSEIADILGVSQSSVSKILKRAKEDYFGEGEN